VRATVRQWIFVWLLAMSSALSATPTEWQQGNWQIRWSSGNLQVRYRGAPLFAVSSPPDLTLRDGRLERSVLALRWQSSAGEILWLCGMVANRFTLVASFPLPSSGQWEWLRVNPNWLRGSVLQGAVGRDGRPLGSPA